MGDLVTLTILGDRIDEIAENPRQFIEELYEVFSRGKTTTILGQTKVQARRHSSEPAIYVQMGNTCCIMDPYNTETITLMKENKEFFEEMLKYLEDTSFALRECSKH